MATELEQRVLAVHAARPGFTSRGFERSGSYDRLAAAVPAGARVLDLACGDGALLSRIPGAIGVDLSPHELALASGVVVRARAQALPFADRSFDVVTCHLALMLFDDLEQVMHELDRVLAPGGSVLAVIGGGPVADPIDDVFPVFLDHLKGCANVLPLERPDWSHVFAGWCVAPWERHELVLDGTFDEVWPFLAACYELPADPRALRAEVAFEGHVRCRAVTWLVRARSVGHLRLLGVASQDCPR